jgi:hypothetical protein
MPGRRRPAPPADLLLENGNETLGFQRRGRPQRPRFPAISWRMPVMPRVAAGTAGVARVSRGACHGIRGATTDERREMRRSSAGRGPRAA